MAGGRGTRIASVASDIPKPMIAVGDKPILERQIDNLRRNGLTDITLVVGYLGEKIRDYFGDGNRFGVNISYFVEDHPLGTAGALFKLSNLADDFLLLCGDTLIDVDFRRFIAFHKEKRAWATLMTHPNGHPYDSSLIETETLPPAEPGGLPQDTRRVARWLNKEDERKYYKNRVNAGLEIISPELLRHTMAHFTPRHSEAPDKIDLDRDVLKPAVATGRIFAYDTPEYIKDMGTPDRFHEAEADLASGIVGRRNLSQRQRAVFLDRDGTINRYVGFLTDPARMELLPGAAEAIRKINKAGWLAIVVTNQPVIARGDCTWEQLRTINEKMETLLGREGAFIDAIYICPHHPDSGFEGERPEYKRTCQCRKPAPGLLLQAARDFNIELAQSAAIGDSDRDTGAAKAAGVSKALKTETNEPGALLRAVEECVGL